MSKVISWLLGLIGLLGSQAGDETITVEAPDTEADADADAEDNKPEGNEEDNVDDGEEEEEEEGVSADGKTRSKTVPRERFDQVNDKANKLERLIELGILVEGDDGEFHVDSKITSKDKSEDKDSDHKSIRFTKEEVSDESWPLVEKINKIADRNDGMMGQLAHMLYSAVSDINIVRDYPEYLQKDGALRKKTMDIIKNDPEFKKTYKNKPDKGYWAVKRAAELLAGKQPPIKKKKTNKSKFIVPRGDGGGKEGAKMVKMSTLTGEELDDMERAEHEKLQSLRKK